MSGGMEAGSCACDVDGDYPEFFRVRDVKAKKQHKCCECSKPIMPGEVYEYASGLWDGSFDTFKTCSTCVAIRRDYGKCTAYGDLREHIWEVLGIDIKTGDIRDDDE